MRKVLTAIVVLIVLAWLIPWDPLPDGEIQVPLPVAPVVATPAATPTEHADSGRAHLAPESTPDVAEPPAPKPQGPATTPAVVLQMVDERGLRVLPIVRENEKAFMIEALDPLWSRSREAEILGQLAQVSGARLSTVEVECRTSMCRLQFTQNVANGSDEHRGVPSPFYAELLARLGYEQMIRPVMARDNAGTVASLAYLPRQQQ